MALSPEEIKNVYPLPVYNYRVDINGESIAFSQVSGISLTVETTTYKESRIDGLAGPSTMRMPAQRSDVTVSLQKGLVPTRSLPALYEWINSVQINQIEKKDVLVHLLDETGAPVVTWKIINAFPTKLDAPTFDASSNDAALESMELMADAVAMEVN